MSANFNTGRRQAQRMIKAHSCVKCGSTEKLERHHKDRNPMNNAPGNVEVLCLPCHHADHKRLVMVSCLICGAMFQPKRARRSVLCGSLSCSREHGKRSAALRWG